MGGCVNQMRDRVSRGHENLLDSRCILKIEQIGFLDRLDVMYEKKRKHQG